MAAAKWQLAGSSGRKVQDLLVGRLVGQPGGPSSDRRRWGRGYAQGTLPLVGREARAVLQEAAADQLGPAGAATSSGGSPSAPRFENRGRAAADAPEGPEGCGAKAVSAGPPKAGDF